MSSEHEVLRQRITELEAENSKTKADKAVIEDMYIELREQIKEEYTRRDAEKAETLCQLNGIYLLEIRSSLKHVMYGHSNFGPIDIFLRYFVYDHGMVVVVVQSLPYDTLKIHSSKEFIIFTPLKAMSGRNRRKVPPQVSALTKELGNVKQEKTGAKQQRAEADQTLNKAIAENKYLRQKPIVGLIKKEEAGKHLNERLTEKKGYGNGVQSGITVKKVGRAVEEGAKHDKKVKDLSRRQEQLEASLYGGKG
ncbi:hypothetical protein RhiirC2_795568 [Rhizophagus irregularis]|uniref:Uncharacterized protein n=1 Tax=Rhizophagus irregularis TaxID=588596 RepID=A0A2N1MBA1_9GLOM|nr:hypothetical protein RhiirC2_795568 [Rhizophagus irregularis]